MRNPGLPEARAAALAASVALCSWAATAHANGRFPRAERLLEDPRDPNHLVLAATYGLLLTSDRGRTWYHVCEASFAGTENYVGDPLFDFAADGTMLVDVQSSLNTSADDGCTWSPAFGGSGAYLPDFTVDRTGDRVLSLISATEDGAVVVRIGESIDHGKTFQPIGTPLPTGIAFTIDVSPSRSDYIYVSARSTSNAPELLSSTDHGISWTHSYLPIGYDEVPYIAAIDPNDPNKIFLRTDVQTTVDGVLTADDALYYSPDGGRSWHEEFRAPAQMLGFALSPDGTIVLLGYGDPVDADIPVDPTVLGVYRASTSDFAFSRVSMKSTTCLSWTRTGIYTCTSPQDTGYALALSDPTSFGPDSGRPVPLLHLNEVQGPPSCCSARTAACAANWPSTCAMFGACDAGAGLDASCTPGKPLQAEGGPTIPANPPRSGCSCRVSPRSRERTPWRTFFGFALICARLWARRPRSAPAAISNRAQRAPRARRWW